MREYGDVWKFIGIRTLVYGGKYSSAFNLLWNTARAGYLAARLE